MPRLPNRIGLSRLAGCVFLCALFVLTWSPAPSLGAPDKTPAIEILIQAMPIDDVVQLAPIRTTPSGPGGDLVVSVTARVDLEPGDVWVYRYEVSNSANSPRGIWSFTLEPVAGTPELESPTGWTGDPAFQRAGQVNWFATDPGPDPPEDDVGPSPFDIAPGSAATFMIRTTNPPSGTATYYVQGFHNTPVAQFDESDVDALLDAQGSFLEEAVTGSILAPGVSTTSSGESGSEGIGALEPARPNPMYSSAAFGIRLSKPGRAKLTVYDAAGKRVCVLLDEYVNAGPHLVTWDGRTRDGQIVTVGQYFYDLTIDGRRVGAKKIMVVR